jgi:CheY-like chemotaxis protein
MRDLLDRTLGDAIRVEVSDASDGTHVRADRVQFENTILNLAVNARDAMEGRGTLAIALGIATLTASRGACAPGDYLRLAVADTGCGMSPEVVERAFEPFFTTKPVGKGTGLGLSQIFAFARQAGGDVEIASVPGSGTRVTLLLPRCQPAATASPAIEPQFLASASGSLRILVVEDDPRVLRATVGALEELGHIPLPCADPLAAPAMLAGAAVDLIISDVLMPGRTGPEMIAALAPEHAALPVLFVTGFAGDAAAGPDLGGRSVLRKPFTLVALERAVAEAAGGRPPEQISAE